MSVNIKGKQYTTVAERIQLFHSRRLVGEKYSIKTDILSHDIEQGIVICKTTIECSEGTFTGMAMENRSQSVINKYSYLMNCETSSIGRALASLGICGQDFCSADELVSALTKQESENVNKEYSQYEKLYKREVKGVPF